MEDDFSFLVMLFFFFKGLHLACCAKHRAVIRGPESGFRRISFFVLFLIFVFAFSLWVYLFYQTVFSEIISGPLFQNQFSPDLFSKNFPSLFHLQAGYQESLLFLYPLLS